MKKENQKLKILYLKEILMRETDERHSLNSSEIIKKLEKYGVFSERKSIYSDIDALNESGLTEIMRESGRGGGFYTVERPFDIAELKMLVDAVQASKFISKKQCASLIKKLSSFASVYEEKQLSRSVYIYDREEKKSSVLYLIDSIHNAISENSSISFVYTEMLPSKKRISKKGGKPYVVSPFALIWQDENYYLVAFDHEAEKIHHYRVDRMENIEILNKNRLGKEEFEKISLSKYCSNVFDMFRGEEEIIHFRCENSLAGAMFDRFGLSLNVKEYDGYFEFYAPLQVSVRFFSWVFGFNGGLTILSPEKVVREYENQIQNALKSLVKD